MNSWFIVNQESKIGIKGGKIVGILLAVSRSANGELSNLSSTRFVRRFHSLKLCALSKTHNIGSSLIFTNHEMPLIDMTRRIFRFDLNVIRQASSVSCANCLNARMVRCIQQTRSLSEEPFAHRPKKEASHCFEISFFQ